MESTRISLARVLDLGVTIGWREAAAIVHEAVARTGPTKGARPTRITPAQCELTRGGDIHLLGDAARARPETVLGLLEYLLPACDSQGGLGVAFESGRAISFLEELGLQVTAKRRRVEIAGVALRALCVDADRLRAEAERARATPPPAAAPAPATDDAWDEPVELPTDLPYDLVPVDQRPAHASERRSLDLAMPTARRQALEPVVSDDAGPWSAPPEWNRIPIRRTQPIAAAAAATMSNEFEQLRAATLRAAVNANQFDVQAALRRALHAVGAPAAIGVVGVGLAVAAWQLWPAPATRPLARPTPAATTAAAVPEAAPMPSAPATPAPPPVSPGPAASFDPAPAPVAVAPVARSLPARVVRGTPPGPAVGSTISPPSRPVVSAAPVETAAAPPAPARTDVVATSPPPAAVVALAGNGEARTTPRAADLAGDTSGADTLYSWVTPGVQPPVLRYPSLASTALKDPGAVIDGPYFEVLVGTDGSVETVRIRGQIDPGETFYRHRMMLAAAKLWRFTPATVNGRPVRYVTRVVLDEP